MPVAKYKKDKKSSLYYTYEKTGLCKSDGTVEYKKLRAKTIAALDEKVKEFRANAAFGVEPSKITVDEWYEQWFVAYKSGCAESTKKFYESLYKSHIKPQIGNICLSQVRETHCQKILTGMTATHSVTTVKDVRSILFSIFEKARKNKLIVLNPAESLDARGKAKKERRILTDAERKQYLAACQKHVFGDFAAFLYFFGLRRGECLALRAENIHQDHIHVEDQIVYPDNNRAAVSSPKTDAGIREIPIPTKARLYIDFDAIRSGSGYLFSDDDGNALSYTEFFYRWDSFIHFALGCDTDITCHCLRHNYCTMLFEKNVPLASAQEYMGHEDIKTTLGVYTHYSESQKKKGDANARLVG